MPRTEMAWRRFVHVRRRSLARPRWSALLLEPQFFVDCFAKFHSAVVIAHWDSHVGKSGGAEGGIDKLIAGLAVWTLVAFVVEFDRQPRFERMRIAQHKIDV